MAIYYPDEPICELKLLALPENISLTPEQKNQLTFFTTVEDGENIYSWVHAYEFFSQYVYSYTYQGAEIALEWDDTTPIRFSSANTIRVECAADSLRNVNYIMFRNRRVAPSTSSQRINDARNWVYAFPVGVNYVNRNVCEVKFLVDDYQTYYTGASVNWHPCMVEREHTETDGYYEHLYPEQFETGEYVYNTITDEFVVDANAILMACTMDKSYNNAVGGMYGGVYSGLCYNVFTNATEANQYISGATESNKASGIISVTQVPSYYINSANPSQNVWRKLGVNPSNDYVYDTISNGIDGYIPRNKKLYNWPYHTLYVTNNAGTGVDMPFEYWPVPVGQEKNYRTLEFNSTMDITANPTIYIAPVGYKLSNYSGNVENANEAIYISNYPTCAWTNDAYQAFLAQERGAMIASGQNVQRSANATVQAAQIANQGIQQQANLNSTGTLLNGLANVLGNIASGNYGGAAGSGVGALWNAYATQQSADVQQIQNLQQAYLSKNTQLQNYATTLWGIKYDHSTKPPQANGAQSSGIAITSDTKKISFFVATIKAEFAKKIDDYFDRFGYLVNELKIPHHNSRPNWNYIKTVDCNLTGSIPPDSLDNLNQMFNNGITLWHNPETFLDYTQNNQPTQKGGIS